MKMNILRETRANIVKQSEKKTPPQSERAIVITVYKKKKMTKRVFRKN